MTNIVDSTLRTYFTNAQQLIVAGMGKRLAYKALIHKKGVDINIDRLARRLQRIGVEDKEQKQPNVVFVNIDGELNATVRIPDINKENAGQIENLGLFLDTIKVCLGVEPSNIKLVFDSSLGKELFMPAGIQRLLTGMVGSARSIDGSFAGTVYKMTTGVLMNLVEMLAAMKLLRDRAGLLRDYPASKGPDGKYHPHPQTNLEVIKAKFNEESGLKAPGIPAYITNMVLSILAQLVKPTNKHFPGAWIHALKVRNGTKSSDAIVAKLGYKPIVVAPNKVLSVLLTKTEEKNSKVSIVPKSKEMETAEDCCDFREFRAGITLLLPLLTSRGNISKKDISVDPLTVKTGGVVALYKDMKDSIDALDLAYSIKVALSNPKNKTATPQHFIAARGKFLNTFSGQETFMDARGEVYERYSELPEHCRMFLEKTLNKKIVGSKRKVLSLKWSLRK